MEAGVEVKIEFPIHPNTVKWIGCVKSDQGQNKDHFSRLDKFDQMNVACNPQKVYAECNDVTFVNARGEIWGLGKHTNGSETPESERLRKIDLPDEVNVDSVDIRKVVVGKGKRMIWAKDGRMFFNGHGDDHCFGIHTHHSLHEKFQEVYVEGNGVGVEEGDRIVDWVSGHQYNSFLTEKGKIIT